MFSVHESQWTISKDALLLIVREIIWHDLYILRCDLIILISVGIIRTDTHAYNWWHQSLFNQLLTTLTYGMGCNNTEYECLSGNYSLLMGNNTNFDDKILDWKKSRHHDMTAIWKPRFALTNESRNVTSHVNGNVMFWMQLDRIHNFFLESHRHVQRLMLLKKPVNLQGQPRCVQKQFLEMHMDTLFRYQRISTVWWFDCTKLLLTMGLISFIIVQ